MCVFIGLATKLETFVHELSTPPPLPATVKCRKYFEVNEKRQFTADVIEIEELTTIKKLTIEASKQCNLLSLVAQKSLTN